MRNLSGSPRLCGSKNRLESVFQPMLESVKLSKFVEAEYGATIKPAENSWQDPIRRSARNGYAGLRLQFARHVRHRYNARRLHQCNQSFQNTDSTQLSSIWTAHWPTPFRRCCDYSTASCWIAPDANGDWKKCFRISDRPKASCFSACFPLPKCTSR